jgi:phenylacetate-coenzyme A ligase PaaK-like adenylate-forming protein
MMEDTLAIRLDPSDAESLPLGRLLQLAERRLVEGNVLERASRSKLYSRRWRRSGVRPEGVHDLAQLQALPYTDADDWLAAQGSGSISRFVAERARLWVSSRGKIRKWVPLGDVDLRRMMGLALRLSAMIGVGPRERILGACREIVSREISGRGLTAALQVIACGRLPVEPSPPAPLRALREGLGRLACRPPL